MVAITYKKSILLCLFVSKSIHITVNNPLSNRYKDIYIDSKYLLLELTFLILVNKYGTWKKHVEFGS
jgi:hypothetical protein